MPIPSSMINNVKFLREYISRLEKQNEAFKTAYKEILGLNDQLNRGMDTLQEELASAESELAQVKSELDDVLAKSSGDTFPQHLLGLSVSSGTLRPEDLMRAFFSIYSQIDPRAALRFIWDNLGTFHRVRDEETEAIEEDEIPETIDALVDLLNNAAPVGYYFGAIEGDGSDFGFWRLSDDEREEHDTDSKSAAVEFCQWVVSLDNVEMLNVRRRVSLGNLIGRARIALLQDGITEKASDE